MKNTKGSAPRFLICNEQPSVTPHLANNGKVTIRIISTLISTLLFVIPFNSKDKVNNIQ